MAIKCTYRWKDGTKTEMLTPIKAIRARCMDCACWNAAEVRNCTLTDCVLWPFRMGRTGNTKRLSPEARKAMRDRLARVRERRGA